MKQCYINENGIEVHVFEKAKYTCNCGKKKHKPPGDLSGYLDGTKKIFKKTNGHDKRYKPYEIYEYIKQNGESTPSQIAWSLYKQRNASCIRYAMNFLKRKRMIKNGQNKGTWIAL